MSDILRSNTSNISSFEHDIDVLPVCSQEIFSRPPKLKKCIAWDGQTSSLWMDFVQKILTFRNPWQKHRDNIAG